MSYLDVQNLTKKYGSKRVLASASFDAQAGEILAILGGNGSGKSTLLSLLAGILRPDAGTILLGGRDLLKDRDLMKDAVAFVPQGTPLFEELTAKDNLKLWYSKAALAASLQEGTLKELGIPEFLNVPVRKLSGGMKKRLSIACAASGNPRLLLLDEPSASLDLGAREVILSYIRHFAETGGTVLIASHDRQEIETAHRHLLIKDGALQPYSYSGPAKLAADL